MKGMIKHENEKLLYEILNECYPNEWKQDTPFLNGRKYRGDAVCEKHKVVIEINGGLHPFYTVVNGKSVLATKGGHSSVAGIERDYEKNNTIVTQGWRLLIYTPKQLRTMPWLLLKDLTLLCGSPTNENKASINLRGLRIEEEPMQIKLGV